MIGASYSPYGLRSGDYMASLSKVNVGVGIFKAPQWHGGSRLKIDIFLLGTLYHSVLLCNGITLHSIGLSTYFDSTLRFVICHDK
jgi:hypothetical protein